MPRATILVRLLAALAAAFAIFAAWWVAWPAWQVKRLVATGSWPEVSLSVRATDRLHAALLAAPIAETGPAVVRRLAGPLPIGWSMGQRSWTHPRVPVSDRTYYVASDTWSEKQRHSSRHEFTAALPSLLLSAANAEARAIVLQSLIICWSAEARPETLRIARAPDEALPTRVAAIKALLRNDDLDAHLPLALDIIEQFVARDWPGEHGPTRLGLPPPLPASQRRAKAFSDVFRNAPAEHASAATRARILAAGRAALEELQDNELNAGYSLAGSLRHIAGNPRGFSPDQKAYRAKPHDALPQAFYTDTVKFARAWFAAHPEATAVPVEAAPRRISRVSKN